MTFAQGLNRLRLVWQRAMAIPHGRLLVQYVRTYR